MRETYQRFVELAVQQFCVDWLHDDFDSDTRINTRAREQFMVDSAMHAMRVDMWLPGKLLQQDREILAWPSNLWQYVRKALGLKYVRQVVRLNEHLLFPTVEIPPEMLKVGAVVRVKVRETMETPEYDPNA